VSIDPRIRGNGRARGFSRATRHRAMRVDKRLRDADRLTQPMP
jgi:hypothetical protein